MMLLALVAAAQAASQPVSAGSRIEVRVIIDSMLRPYQQCTIEQARAAMSRRNVREHSFLEWSGEAYAIRNDVLGACAAARQDASSSLEQFLIGRPPFEDVEARRAAIELLLVYSDRTSEPMFRQAGGAGTQASNGTNP